MNDRVTSSALARARSSRSTNVSFICLTERIEKGRRLDAAERLEAACPARNRVRSARGHARLPLPDLRRQCAQVRAPPFLELAPAVEQAERGELLQFRPRRGVGGDAARMHSIRPELAVCDGPHGDIRILVA